MIAIRILILSFLIPSEFRFNIGTLSITAYRFVLLALAPYVLWLGIKKVQKRYWNLCDLLACTIFVWPIIAFLVNTGLGAALESGGVLALEMSVPYFLVRLSITSYHHRKEFAKLMFFLVAVLFISGIPESLTGHYYIREFAGNITGNMRSFFASEQRLGIWRAAGPTDHPILFGTLCASIAAVSISLALRRSRYWIAVFCSLGGVVLSASSAPLLSVLVQLGLLLWAAFFRTFKRKWWLFLACFALGYVAVDLISSRDPIRVMFTYLLLNPDTGYARYYMWSNSFYVIAHTNIGMVFGHGYDNSIFDVLTNNYFRILMQNTVDSYWLVQMLRYGITMLVFFALFLVLTFRRTAKGIGKLTEKKDRNLLQAWFFSAIAMTLLATTVHFWGQMSCIYMMILAICVSGANPKGSRQNRSRRRKPVAITTTIQTTDRDIPHIS